MRPSFSSRTVIQEIKGMSHHHQIAQPDRAPQGMILLFPAFEGWSPFIEEYAEFFASQGFLSVAVDFYGQRQLAKNIDECFSLVEPYLGDRSLVRSKAKDIFDYWQGLFPDLSTGAMGFCFGVQAVLELARTETTLRSAVGAHGMLAQSELPSMEKIHSSVLMIQGYSDPMVPPEDCLEFAQEMTQKQVQDWNIVFVGQAQHSFTDPRTGTFEPEREKEMGRVFDEVAAKRTQSWAKDFFEQTLLPLI